MLVAGFHNKHSDRNPPETCSPPFTQRSRAEDKARRDRDPRKDHLSLSAQPALSAFVKGAVGDGLHSDPVTRAAFDMSFGLQREE